MERLMQYVWQHRLWLTGDMLTVDGERVEVLDPGLLNTDAGPDFFNAKIRIGDREWAGNVEIHVKASDWKRHGHDRDAAYDSVILHVVYTDDCRISRPDGQLIPQLVLRCAADFNAKYRSMVDTAADLPCSSLISELPAIYLSDWLTSLALERLFDKADRVYSLVERHNMDWYEAIYIVLARGLGFSTNSDAFERLAMSIPLRYMLRHQGAYETVEGALFGMAGFLDGCDTGSATEDNYKHNLLREYRFFTAKYGLEAPKSLGWKMARMRPQNFPHRRLALLASIIADGFSIGRNILAVRDVDDAKRLFNCYPTHFWRSHYTFCPTSAAESAKLGIGSIMSLIINVVVPVMYSYGTHHGIEELKHRAVELLENIPPENNRIVRQFIEAGVNCPDAFSSQALIQLRRNYCEPRKCLYCRIGHRLLASRALLRNQ